MVTGSGVAVRVGPMTQGTWTEPPPAAPPTEPPNGTMIIPGPDGITDFSEAHLAVRFRVDDDVFTLVPGLPAMTMVEFVQLAQKQSELEDPTSVADLMQEMYRMVLTTDCIERFIERLADRDRPITLWQVQKITPWVLEQMGMRPTEPSGSSSDGSPNPESGPSLTANAPLPESISGVYPFPNSSTTATGS